MAIKKTISVRPMDEKSAHSLIVKGHSGATKAIGVRTPSSPPPPVTDPRNKIGKLIVSLKTALLPKAKPAAKSAAATTPKPAAKPAAKPQAVAKPVTKALAKPAAKTAVTPKKKKK